MTIPATSDSATRFELRTSNRAKSTVVDAPIGALAHHDLSGIQLDGASGVLWGLNSDQLNANLVVVAAGESMPRHRNDEVDVLIIVESGTGVLRIDETDHQLAQATVALVPRGTQRSIEAATRLTYYTVHVRRGAGPH